MMKKLPFTRITGNSLVLQKRLSIILVHKKHQAIFYETKNNSSLQHANTNSDNLKRRGDLNFFRGIERYVKESSVN